MKINLKQKYRSKAKDSFKTKINLYLFDSAIHNIKYIDKNDFINFIISKELVKQYCTEYWQLDVTHSINGVPISAIEKKIKSFKNNNVDVINHLMDIYIESFTGIFPFDEFKKLTSGKTCDYCGIHIDDIHKLGNHQLLNKKSLRGWTLEIDRLNSNFEYTSSNCVMSCYWCNNAKTDEFDYSEFKEIGNAIRNIWLNRLNDIR